MNEHNPFAAPETMDISVGTDNRSAAAIRQQHLTHEASVQSVGSLYLLGSIIVVIAAAVMIYLSISSQVQNSTLGIFEPLFIMGLGVGQGFIGFGLRNLKSWGRIPAALFAGIGLLAFPIGTLINGYILYLLLSAKGRMVFSAEYREIIQQTPEIKYRTSKILLFFVFLLVGVIVLGVGALILGGR